LSHEAISHRRGLAGRAFDARACRQPTTALFVTGYCAVLDSHPSPASNLKIIGKGYDTRDAAEQALKGQAHCTT
jgi:hypothetical protein